MKYAIRSMFIAPKGKTFLAMDLSQAENWVTAFSAREHNMKDALINGDIHRRTASAIFEKPEEEITKEERYVGKRLNHALSYRMSAERLYSVFNKDAQVSGVVITLPQAKRYRDKWHSFYHIKSWWKEIEAQLNQDRTITTIYGRRRIFYGRWGDELFKEATAFLPQSTVADHALGAIQSGVNCDGGIRGIYKWCSNQREIKLVHTAHDSVVLEVPKNFEEEIAPQVYKLFARPMCINGEVFTIPCDCEIGERWGEMEQMERSKYASP